MKSCFYRIIAMVMCLLNWSPLRINYNRARSAEGLPQRTVKQKMYLPYLVQFVGIEHPPVVPMIGKMRIVYWKDLCHQFRFLMANKSAEVGSFLASHVMKNFIPCLFCLFSISTVFVGLHWMLLNIILFVHRIGTLCMRPHPYPHHHRDNRTCHPSPIMIHNGLAIQGQKNCRTQT